MQLWAVEGVVVSFNAISLQRTDLQSGMLLGILARSFPAASKGEKLS